MAAPLRDLAPEHRKVGLVVGLAKVLLAVTGMNIGTVIVTLVEGLGELYPKALM